MTTEGFKRKLTAILSADVVGYSRLMGDDEEATIRTLTAYRSTMSTLIQQYRGRVVDTTGDNLLAEFISAVDAVNCAVEIQRDLAERNAELSYERRMEFRVGVNVGDVVEEEDRIYGDGVNIAARVEGLAEAGGICISGRVYDQVENKLDLEFEFLGEQEVKNIAKPVRVYRVLSFPGAAAHRVVKAKRAVGRTWRNIALSIAAVLVLGGVVAIWWFYMRPSPPSAKPSIAVLPFTNLSDDPEQEYFSDGMTDALTTDLSKISGLNVIARTSSFKYKGKALKVQEVGKDLGVRYLLEGSVLKGGNDLRITAQLIDATTGHHLWAERYDGKMKAKDLFTLQDRITNKIVSALKVKLTMAERKLVEIMETDSIEAYDDFQRGYGLFKSQTVDGIAASIKYFEKAIELDENYGRAYAALAKAYFMPRAHGKELSDKIGLSFQVCMLRSRHYFQLAMKRPTDSSHEVASWLALNRRKYDKAMAEAERALALNPSGSDVNWNMGIKLVWVGRPKEAINYLKRALELDPLHPGWPLFFIGVAHFTMDQFDEAVDLIEGALTHNPKQPMFKCILAAAYAHLGHDKKARDALNDYMKVFEGAPVKPDLSQIMNFWIFKEQKDADRLAHGLVKAGFPDRASDYIKISKQNKLTGKEIRKLLFGHTMKGTTWSGLQWSRTSTKEGRCILTYKFGSKSGSDTGKIWIEGDRLFTQYETFYEGRKYDMEIYSNPGGSAERMDEYCWICDFAVYPFSVVD